MTTTPAHLGGHQQMTWVDLPVLTELIRRYEVRTMLDVGCGPGGMLDAARGLGLTALGIDGDPQITRPDVITHDYTQGPLELGMRFDLVWCCEFVEHVESRYLANYFLSFRAGRVLYLTHALPGQGGHHHVNEQSPEYWRILLSADGWIEATETTAWVRKHSATPFGRQTGSVFAR